MQQEKLTGKTRPCNGENDKAKKLSVMTLFVKLMTDPTYQRRRWAMRNFRYRFFLRTLFVYPDATFRYLRALCELENLEQLLEASPVLPAKLHRPYLYRSNTVRQRAQAVLEHYQFVRTQPEPVRRYLQVYRETPLVTTEGRGGEQISVTCTPCGFDREGELMLVLYCDGTPVIRISFSFIRWRRCVGWRASLLSVKNCMFCNMTDMLSANKTDLWRVTVSAGYRQVVCMTKVAFTDCPCRCHVKMRKTSWSANGRNTADGMRCWTVST